MKRKILLQDLADYLVQHVEADPHEAEAFMRAFFGVVEQGLLEDRFVKIKGLGTFKLVTVSDRESVNINTGERFQIESHVKVSFTPDNAMKELVNRPFAHFETVDLSDETDMSELESVNGSPAVTEAEEVLEEEGCPLPPEGITATGLEGGDEEVAGEETRPEAVPDSDGECSPSEGADPSGAVLHDSLENAPLSPEASAPEESPVSPSGNEDVGDQAGQEAFHSDSLRPKAQSELSVSFHPSMPKPEEPAVVENEEQDAGTDSTVQAEDSAEKEVSCAETSSAGGGVPPIAPQGTFNYTYADVPSRRRRNYWKTAAIVLGLFVLMSLCYFAGYFRVLCPCSIPYLDGLLQRVEMADTSAVSQPASATTPSPAAAVPPVRRTDTVAVSPQPPVSKPVPEENASDVTEVARPAALSRKVQAQSVVPARPPYYVVKTGDNLYKISRKFYGSDRQVPALIKLNKLEDANTITRGTRLKLP